MGFDFGALVRGAARGITGYEEGRRERTEAERQARMELMRERLNAANIQRLMAQAQRAATLPVEREQWTYHYDPETGSEVAFNVRTGERRILPSERGKRAGKVEQPPEFEGQLVQNEAGEYVWIPKPVGVSQVPQQQLPPALPATAARGVVETGVRGKPQTQREPTSDQTRLAEFGSEILEGHAIMTALESQDPGIGQRVDAKVRPLLVGEKFGAVGSAVATALQPAIVGTMTPEEQDYWSAVSRVVNAKLRRASGAQINKEELEREGRPFIPLAGEGEQAVLSKQQARIQAAQRYLRSAGEAFSPDLLSPGARATWDQLQQHKTPKDTTRTTARRLEDLESKYGIKP